MSSSNRAGVRDLPVTRRAGVTPQQAGLTFYGGNRRVPGLRREEAAMLAGVSADCCTRLGKGQPGRRVRHRARRCERSRRSRWGDRWLAPAGVELRHHDCGAVVYAELRCADGHQLTVPDIDLASKTPDGHHNQLVTITNRGISVTRAELTSIIPCATREAG